MPNITPLMSMPPSKEIPPMEEIEASMNGIPLG